MMGGQTVGKRYLRMTMSVCLAAVCLAVVFSGCSRQEQSLEETSADGLKVVCTIFPEYDWVKQILGGQAENAELTLLMKNGSDMHSYQPTVWDMVKISEADLFIYVGGESDFWVEDALANAKNPDRKVLNLMEILENSVKEEEHAEGMQGAPDDDDPEEAPEYDEHIWLSLRNAKTACGAVCEMLCGLDPEHSAVYRQNEADYVEQLHALDQEYCQVAKQALTPVLLFGDRFPFLYLTKDYGITYYAAFAGCSAETEASFETIRFLIEKADEQNLPAVLTIDGSDKKIAQAIAENTKNQNAKVLVLDSMQSVSEEDIANGENYLSIMERNLETLKEALLGR